MRIKEYLNRNRRDFTAIYICEHCGHEETMPGYDDGYFHRSVIPEMVCKACGKKSPDWYKPNDTRYPDGLTV